MRALAWPSRHRQARGKWRRLSPWKLPTPVSSWPSAKSAAEHFLERGRGDGPVGPDVELADISAGQNLLANCGRHLETRAASTRKIVRASPLRFAFGEEPVYERVPELGGHQVLQRLPRRLGYGTSDKHSVGRESAVIEETMAGSSICGRG